MKIVSIEMVTSYTDEEAIHHALHNLFPALDWLQMNPNMCYRMFMFLTTNRASYLDDKQTPFTIISLRTLEECITQKLRGSAEPVHIATFQSYRRAVNDYTKTFFDLYCRNHIVRLHLCEETVHPNTSQIKLNKRVLVTSIAQLNLLRWLLTWGVDCLDLATKLSQRKRYRLCLSARNKKDQQKRLGVQRPKPAGPAKPAAKSAAKLPAKPAAESAKPVEQ